MSLGVLRALWVLGAVALVPGCGEKAERSGRARADAELAPWSDASPPSCHLDRPDGCSGAWCESLAASVAGAPCAVFEALSAAPCLGGAHPERCEPARGPRLVELAAKVGEDLVPLVHTRVRCGRMRIVPSSCTPGLRVTYVFRGLPDGSLFVQSALHAVHLDSRGEPEFSTVLCGSCAQLGRLDVGWEPSSVPDEQLQQLLSQLEE